MKVNKLFGAYGIGVVTIVLGAAVGKYLGSPDASIALCTAGGLLIGKLRPQPRFARAKPTLGKVPDGEKQP